MFLVTFTSVLLNNYRLISQLVHQLVIQTISWSSVSGPLTIVGSRHFPLLVVTCALDALLVMSSVFVYKW